MKNEKIWKGILSLYILIFPVKILQLPLTGDKLQIGDFLFLILLVLSFFHLDKLKNWRISLIDKAVLCWVSVQITTCAFHPTQASILECVGAIYLALLYGIVNLFWLNSPPLARRHFFLQNIGLAILTWSVLGIAAYLAAYAGYPTTFVDFYPNYPYLGDVYRLCFLTHIPTMAASILSVFLLFLIGNTVEGTRNSDSLSLRGTKQTKGGVWQKKWTIVLGSIALLLTLSKSGLMFFACWVGFFLFKKEGRHRILAYLILAISFVLSIFATHFVLIGKQKFHSGIVFFLDKNPFAEFGNHYLVKTMYALLKEKSIAALLDSPIVGIGSGNLNTYSPNYFAKNFDYAANYDPHSTLIGVLAEMGLLGFAALFFLFYSLFRTLVLAAKLPKSDAEQFFIYGLFFTLINMSCEAVVTDVMNFRHFWLIFAFIALYFRKSAPQNTV